jgi:hypothetical protein
MSCTAILFFILQEISLRGCVALSDLELNCWRLATLRLGPMQSGTPGNATLQRLALYSGALRKMEWVQCRCDRVCVLEHDVMVDGCGMCVRYGWEWAHVVSGQGEEMM